MKWIKCSDKMPKMNEDVLVFIDFGNHREVTKADLDEHYTAEKVVWRVFQDWYDLDNITHWMPLPAFPDSKDDDLV